MAGQGSKDATSAPRRAEDPAVDNPVCLAFQLGWDMSCLYHQARLRQRNREFRVRKESGGKAYPKLPAQNEFTSGQRTERRIVAVSAGLFHLSPHFERAGFQPPSVESVRVAFEGDDQDGLRQEAFELHVRTLLLLQAADARLGSAYNLGRALMTTGSAGEGQELKEKFRRARIAGLRDELSDLVTALPDHSGRAVASSLCWWQCAMEPVLAGLQEGQTPRLVKRLDRQAEMWRALLSGEKRGPDMLSVEDYTGAAGRLLRHAGSIVRTALRGRWRLLLLTLVAVAGVIALAVAVGGVEGTVAAVAAIGAVFGVSWKSTGATVGTIARQLQGPLWHAELDLAIGEAITDPAVRTAYRRLPAKGQRCPIG